MKTTCTIKNVYLKNEIGEEIPYGNLAAIHDLPKTKIVKDKNGNKVIVNGKPLREKIKYDKTFYEQWQQRKTDKIVENLNKFLNKRYRGKKENIYYFTKLETAEIKI